MVISTAKSWPSIAFSGALLLCAATAAAPVKAQTPCPGSKLIEEIVSSTPATYTCELGNITYEFNQTLNVFYIANPAAKIVFTDAPSSQTLSFQNLSNDNIVGFDFKIKSPFESILQIDQTASLNSSPPLYPPNGLTSVNTTEALPTNPSLVPFNVEVIYEPDTFALPQPPIINTLTYTIQKTPAPLPLAGTSFAFALSRKLRKRLRQVT